jgi:hypothetical protein
MITLTRDIASVALASIAVAGLSLPLVAQRDNKNENPRPKLTLTARPSVGVAPVRITLTAELVGGANDFQEYYCPTVLWDWADGTESEQTVDCEPYEAGKTEITRRFTQQHTFRNQGGHKVWVRLKRNDRLLASANVIITIQPGRAGLDDR